MPENRPGTTPEKFPIMQTRPPKNLAPGEKYPGTESGENIIPEVFSIPNNRNVVLNSNFPQLPRKKGDQLPLPSLEDVRDSEKTEYFSIEENETEA